MDTCEEKFYKIRVRRNKRLMTPQTDISIIIGEGIIRPKHITGLIGV